MIQVLTEEAFEKAVKQDPGTVVVDVYAKTCLPCRVVAKALDEIEPQHPAVKFVKVDGAAMFELTLKLGITGVPTVLVYAGGREVGRIVGLKNGPRAYMDFIDGLERLVMSQ